MYLRSDIAERLHNVMETQWQRALEIITSPSDLPEQNHQQHTRRHRSIDLSEIDQSKLDGVANWYHRHRKAENEVFHTPKTSRIKKQNDLNEPKVSGNDKLQSYIEMVMK